MLGAARGCLNRIADDEERLSDNTGPELLATPFSTTAEPADSPDRVAGEGQRRLGKDHPATSIISRLSISSTAITGENRLRDEISVACEDLLK